MDAFPAITASGVPIPANEPSIPQENENGTSGASHVCVIV